MGELLVLLVALDGCLDSRDLLEGHIAAAVFALFPGIEIVVGAVGALAGDTEGAMLHVLDLEDLLEEYLGIDGSSHGGDYR